MNTEKNDPRMAEGEGKGRTHNTEGHQKQGTASGTDSADISGIDQQEGTMANGELGDVDRESDQA